MKEKLIILDAGHGGLIEGKYTTYPHKRYELGDRQINEGVLNRATVSLLAFYLDAAKINVHILTHCQKDDSLSKRVKIVNRLSKDYYCTLYSIHHNYSDHKSAHGCELYTYYGETKADVLAEKLARSYYKTFPRRKFRRYSINKASKEAGYCILKNTKCPAILTEFSFMSNPQEFLDAISGDMVMDEVRWLYDHIIKTYE